MENIIQRIATLEKVLSEQQTTIETHESKIKDLESIIQQIHYGRSMHNYLNEINHLSKTQGKYQNKTHSQSRNLLLEQSPTSISIVDASQSSDSEPEISKDVPSRTLYLTSILYSYTYTYTYISFIITHRHK